MAIATVHALGAFTAAITNTGTFTAGSIVLEESGSSHTCYSTGSASGQFANGNSYSCSTIDVFAATAQEPGAAASTQTLTFTNLGSSNAGSFTVNAGTCSTTPVGTNYGNDSGTAFCGDVDVTIGNQAGTVCYYPAQANACPPPSSAYTLTSLGAAGPLPIGAGLASQASDVLVVTTQLDSAASNEDMGLQATQAFTWTLSQ
jgi:hypothetical protein